MEVRIFLEAATSQYLVGFHQAGFRPVAHRHRNGTVERHHRARSHVEQGVVEPDDLVPIGVGWVRSLGVDSGDRRLGLVLTRHPPPQGPGEDLYALRHHGVIPQLALLFFEEDKAAVVCDPGAAPGVGQQHQGEQTTHLRLVGHQAPEDAGQPNRFLAQIEPQKIVPGRSHVAGGECQIEGRQHPVEPVGQLVGTGDPVRDPGRGDLALRPDQSLCHGRLVDQKGAGDLGGGQPAEQPEGERHPRLGVESRVAAGEDEA